MVHGEPEAASKLAQTMHHELGWPSVIVPEYRESAKLFTGI
nr:MBL fold metallo-hydrolase RNA specificity domain-containing protein [Hymenobacter radiodurans]